MFKVSLKEDLKLSGIKCETLSETSYNGVKGEEFSVNNYHDGVYEINVSETGGIIYYVERIVFNEYFSLTKDPEYVRLIAVESVPLNCARANDNGSFTTLGRAGKIFDVGSEFELREIQDGKYILLDLENLEFYSIYPINTFGFFKPVKRDDTFERCQVKDISLDELKIEIKTVEFETLDDFIERARVLSTTLNTIVTFNVHNDSGIVNRYLFDSGHKFHRSFLDNKNLNLDFNTDKLVITTKYNVAMNDFPIGCRAIINTLSLKTNMFVTFEPNSDGYYVLTIVGKGVEVFYDDADTTKWLLSTLERVRLMAKDYMDHFNNGVYPEDSYAIKRCNDIENSGRVDSIPILENVWNHRKVML